MSFDSYTFIFFLAAVLLLHRALPWRTGKIMLLFASYIFYGAGNPWHCLLLLASTIVDFNIARGIHQTENNSSKKALLALSLLVNLGLLLSFKYGGFFVENLNTILTWFSLPNAPIPGWTLPIGISFYTFQTMSYTLDVYQGKEKPTRNFIEFSLFVAFFPQLVAGPIERFSRLMPQLRAKQPLCKEDMELGFQRILTGLVKKMVIADRLGLFVDRVYESPLEGSASALVIATACFALQVYMDFSGYCDIAIGSSRMMGIRLSENFRFPILARNPVDFWSRWHITLGTWFRDYLFTALIGKKRPKAPRAIFNFLFVLTLMGFWHGPGWNFILFGLAAGLAIAVYEGAYIFGAKPRSKPLFGNSHFAVFLAVGLTNLHLLILALLFRSPTLTHAKFMVVGILKGPWSLEPHVAIFAAASLLVWLGCIGSGVFIDRLNSKTISPPARAGLWLGLLLLLLYGSVDTAQPFIYFQF